MPILTGGKVIEGSGLGEPLLNAGAPTAGTNAVITLTKAGTVSGGTYRLAFDGVYTADLAYNLNNAGIQAALDGLSTMAASDFTVGGGGFPTTPVTLTAGGRLGLLAVPLARLTVDPAKLTGTGHGITPTLSTAGVTASGRGAPIGAKLIDITNGVDYINTGTAILPTWTKTGTQS